MAAHEGLHEAQDKITPATLELHRALVSMIEELEAADWYQQRVDASDDPALAEILLHHRNEEIEHFAMLLEYVRRNVPKFDEVLRTYLFKEGNITQLEKAAEQAGGASKTGGPFTEPLTIGSLKGRPT